MLKRIIDKVLPREVVISLIDLRNRLFSGQDAKVIFAKWAANKQVIEWREKGWLSDRDFRILAFEWEKFGSPVPPPHQVKEEIVKNAGENRNIDTLIETGTYRGDMIDRQKNNFTRIFSIELSEELWKRAVERFEEDKHIEVVQGDSGRELKSVLKKVPGPAVFWLDGHYSGGITAKGESNCPIYGELDAIFETKRKDHIILIDDARLFNGTDDYPTLKEIEDYIRQFWPDSEMIVEWDIVKIYN